MLGFETVAQATIRDGGIDFTNDGETVCKVETVVLAWNETPNAYACHTCGALVLTSLVELHAAKTHGWITA